MPVKRYNGTSWDIVAGDGATGAQGAAATSSSIVTWVKTASGGETSVSGSGDTGYGSLSYTVGQELVYLNGVLLVRGSDYIATTGTNLTGLTALTAGDIVSVWTVNSFSVANTYTIAQADAAFAPINTGMVLLNPSSTSLAGLSGTVTFNSISQSYKDLVINIYGVNPSSTTAECMFRLNGDSGTNYPRFENYDIIGATTPGTAYQNTSGFSLESFGRSYLQNGTTKNFWRITIPKYTLTDTKLIQWQDEQNLGGTNTRLAVSGAAYLGTSAITSISLVLSTGTFTTGNIEIYGVK
jgi:hypothetical protein